MWNLIFKNDTNELIYKTETDLADIKTKLLVTKGEMGRRGINQELEINLYTLLYICKIDNQQGPTVYLRELYSISLIPYMRKESKKK